MRVLMVDPLYYEIHWEDPEKNPWMKLKNQPLFLQKFFQWARLVELYEDRDVTDDFIPPVPGLSDMVFCANAGWIYHSTFVPSNFDPPERKPEAAHYLRWFAEHGFETRTLKPELSFEGQSDIIELPNTYLYFHGPRNSPDVPRELEVMFALDRPMITLRLAPQSGFYHGDLAFFYIRKTNKLLYCPEAFDAESAAIIQSLPCDVRAVPLNVAVQRSRDGKEYNFPLNAVDLGNTIIMPWNLAWDAIPSDLYRWLTEGNVRAVFHNFSEFAKSGAGIRCATFVIEK